ncbi:ribosome biosynthesis protein nip7 [Coniosporium tulheliwenetii]|uniref:Ribosome biosynthesis protein nip7 n=1 Tax=Coniosporium tulheliwenetii TaxID=3383036 RepID=A0ACC2YWS6_9PEZI|nr:ribosome biosynthesis protein nip7 [Cladosporium sp. JES 115]
MRPLTDTETQTLFAKLANYTGRSLTHLLTDTTPSSSTTAPDRHVFRIQNSRVYYVRSSLANLATSIARPNLLSLGTCLGKFTKTGKFRLHITALDVIAPHARYKGFGVTARSTAEVKRLEPTGVTCFRQADIGEYLRDEDTLFAT